MLEAWHVEEWREKRLWFMNRLYDATGGSQLATADGHELGNELGLSSEETDRVIEYLKGEQLLTYTGLGGIGITHHGVLEVEKALPVGSRALQHLPMGGGHQGRRGQGWLEGRSHRAAIGGPGRLRQRGREPRGCSRRQGRRILRPRGCLPS